jgi:hypothetical protein
MSFGSVQNWTRASISWRAPTSPGNWRKLEQVSNLAEGGAQLYKARIKKTIQTILLTVYQKMKSKAR